MRPLAAVCLSPLSVYVDRVWDRQVVPIRLTKRGVEVGGVDGGGGCRSGVEDWSILILLFKNLLVCALTGEVIFKWDERTCSAFLVVEVLAGMKERCWYLAWNYYLPVSVQCSEKCCSDYLE